MEIVIDDGELLKYVEAEPRFNGEKNAYIESMRKMPEYDYSKFYSNFTDFDSTVLQGDLIKGLKYVRLPNTKGYTARCMIFSNSCDIETSNSRPFPSRVIYAPLIKLSDFKKTLQTSMLSEGKPEEEVVQDIDSYVDTIKKQKIIQIFYLPEGQYMEEESIVFFSSLINNDNAAIPRDNLAEARMVSLSSYGWHIFLIRLSAFFTRLTDETVQLRFGSS